MTEREAAGEVLEEIVEGFEGSIDDFMKRLFIRAMAAEMEIAVNVKED
ncbi:MAG TPA: hypothetical protein H9768_11860 [Candidatus Mailhella merdavium]|nr:hypothetical protein [Candidatus Mailhella merdavium]